MKKKKTVRKSGPKKLKLSCPKCGNTDLCDFSMLESVLMTTPLIGRKDNTLLIDGLANEIEWDSAVRHGLYCMAPLGANKFGRCYTQFPMPEGFDIDEE